MMNDEFLADLLIGLHGMREVGDRLRTDGED